MDVKAKTSVDEYLYNAFKKPECLCYTRSKPDEKHSA